MGNQPHNNFNLTAYRKDWPVILFSALYMLVFVGIALTRQNYEFVLYAAVVVVIAIWILAKQSKVQFSSLILWSLSFWGLLHMAGGNIRVGDSVLYNVQLIPVILRYDQFVHALGFGAATLVCHHVLMTYVNPSKKPRLSFVILVTLMGCGVGAINEIVEFIAVRAMPETNVGGYENTLWDLVFNLLGSSIAAVWAVSRQRRSQIAGPKN